MATMPCHPSSSDTHPGPWAGPIFLAVLGVGLTAWTWRKWPDLLVDFGRELYVPWAITMGKVLYVDIAYFNGPFSPYLNALWFWLFGVSLTTLVFCNLAILAILTGLIYSFFSAACDRLTAALCGAVFLCMFAFSHYTSFGSQNYVCPYSHEATHGVCLAIATIFCLSRYLTKRRLISCAVAGMFFGLTFLTKAEIFAATAAAVFLGLSMAVSLKRTVPGRDVGMAVYVFAGSAAVPVLLFYLFLHTQMPAKYAVAGIGGTWTAILGGGAFFGVFQRNMMGLDHPGSNIRIMFSLFTLMVLLAAVVAAADYASRNNKWGRMLAGVSLGAIILELFLDRWWMIAHPLPLVTIGACAALTAASQRMSADPSQSEKFSALAIWSIFSALMLGKMALRAEIDKYGFFLAMPAFLMLVAGIVYLIPAGLRTGFGGGGLFRWISIATTACAIAVHGWNYGTWYRLKNMVVGRAGDSIVTYGPADDVRGIVTATALREIESLIPRTSTVAVLPEGAILNYLSRRLNSTPYIDFMPTTVDIFGETNILKSFRTTPPDFIILVHRSTREYGVGYFGSDPRYGRQIMDWIENHYAAVRQIWAEPLKDGRFGIKILKKR